MQYLIYDGNYILMKSVFTLHKLNRLYGDLWTLLDNNIEKYTALNSWEKIIIVSDSRKKSWRVKESEIYKSHRVRQEDIDWEFVFKTYADWKESIADKYIILEKDHIEGDDWITSTILLANKKNKSCTVISSDQDLYQLINYKLKGNKSWMNIQINDILGREKVIVPEGWELWLKEFSDNNNNDVFQLSNSLKHIDFFNYVIRNWNYEEINCYQKLFEKIVQGDKSDNISSIYQKITTTGKIQNIGKAGATKIWNFYKDNYDIHYIIDNQFIEDIIVSLEKTNNLEFNETTKNKIRNNIKLNIKLIQLHYNNYPDWVLEEIIEQLNEKI